MADEDVMQAAASSQVGGPSSTPMRPSPSKPRLLYRGPLCLPDGTLLPGVAFVSTISPFGPTPFGSHDYDAEICLALEMARNHGPLGISVLDESGPTASSAKPSKLTTTANGKASSRPTEYRVEASGHIKMYIDPAEHITAALFERNFAWHDDWAADPHKERSRIAFSISTSPATIRAGGASQSLGAGGNTQQEEDPFVSSYSSTIGSTAPTTSLDRRSSALQLVIFARMGRACSHDDSSSSTLDVLVGRRIVEKRKAQDAGNVPRPARPDDPLPRDVALAGRMHSDRDSAQRAGHKDPSWRKTASVPHLTSSASSSSAALPISLSQLKQATVGSAEQTGKDSYKAASGTDTNARVTTTVGGNHTPGRRGEKRRSRSTADVRNINSSPSSKRARGVERSSSSVRSKVLGSRAERLPKSDLRGQDRFGETSSQLALPSTMSSPEPPDSATFATFEESARGESLSANMAARGEEGTFRSSVELSNRATIKKLVQFQLLGKGLMREDEEFVRCFNATYNGTVVAMKPHGLADVPVDRATAAHFVTCHLAMYLPSPFNAPFPLSGAWGSIPSPVASIARGRQADMMAGVSKPRPSTLLTANDPEDSIENDSGGENVDSLPVKTM